MSLFEMSQILPYDLILGNSLGYKAPNGLIRDIQ